MDEIFTLVLVNLEKIEIGVAVFLGAYFSNMGLGAWKNVKIEGYDFDWKIILQSIVKFIVLGLSLGLLSMVVSVLPAYTTYVGISINPDTMQTIDSIVIIGTFLTATIRYVSDAISKLKEILS